MKDVKISKRLKALAMAGLLATMPVMGLADDTEMVEESIEEVVEEEPIKETTEEIIQEVVSEREDKEDSDNLDGYFIDTSDIEKEISEVHTEEETVFYEPDYLGGQEEIVEETIEDEESTEDEEEIGGEIGEEIRFTIEPEDQEEETIEESITEEEPTDEEHEIEVTPSKVAKRLHIITPDGEVEIDIDSESDLSDLKKAIESKLGIKAEEQSLYLNWSLLVDGVDYDIMDGEYLILEYPGKEVEGQHEYERETTGRNITIKVRTSKGIYNVKVNSNPSVMDIKSAIEKKLGIDIDEQSLYLNWSLLVDGIDYDIMDGEYLILEYPGHLVDEMETEKSDKNKKESDKLIEKDETLPKTGDNTENRNIVNLVVFTSSIIGVFGLLNNKEKKSKTFRK